MQKEDKNSILVIIPCYNVSKTINGTLSKITNVTLKKISKIIVIDNQSTDDTFEKIKSIKKKNQNLKNKIILAQNKNNYGLGGSLKNAFIFSILNKFDYSIIIHSDEQGESETILSQFIQQIEKNPNIDFFMASRFIKESKLEGYSKIRIIGNLFFNFLTYILTRVKLTDSGCGIIAVKTEILKKINFLKLNNNFHFNPELNVYLLKLKNLVKKDLPIIWKDSDIPSNLRVIKYLFGLTSFLILFNFRNNSKFELTKDLIEKFQKTSKLKVF